MVSHRVDEVNTNAVINADNLKSTLIMLVRFLI